ncbi:hypothetical protein NPIL_320351 [Nephila pilipes]|uniref:Uncharacterized protein n=1 Tax=Nephila pilipes TaxID=299642 RepID=A0A8X6SZF5_NEPPI|nr:hypothetical protein NPIL_320351 [Nephila pilipes]
MSTRLKLESRVIDHQIRCNYQSSALLYAPPLIPAHHQHSHPDPWNSSDNQYFLLYVQFKKRNSIDRRRSDGLANLKKDWAHYPKRRGPNCHKASVDGAQSDDKNSDILSLQRNLKFQGIR